MKRIEPDPQLITIFCEKHGFTIGKSKGGTPGNYIFQTRCGCEVYYEAFANESTLGYAIEYWPSEYHKKSA